MENQDGRLIAWDPASIQVRFLVLFLYLDFIPNLSFLFLNAMLRHPKQCHFH